MKAMLDAVLLPKAFYKSMSVSKYTFFYCICAIGVFSVGYPFLVDNFNALFLERSFGEMLFNIALTILLILLIGLMDTVVYCRPIADLFGYISEKTGGYKDKYLLIKTVKVYFLSAVIVNPVFILVSRFIFYDIAETTDVFKINIYFITVCLMQMWSFGIMSRGMNSILRYKSVKRVFVFLVISIWAMVWAFVFKAFIMEILVRLYLI